jgi:hypothetical protein
MAKQFRSKAASNLARNLRLRASVKGILREARETAALALPKDLVVPEEHLRLRKMLWRAIYNCGKE